MVGVLTGLPAFRYELAPEPSGPNNVPGAATLAVTVHCAVPKDGTCTGEPR
jgi:hypothetical protein